MNKKHITRVLSILAIVVLAIVLPACESSGDYGYSATYVG
jgi:ABC-type cobalt transport system substrate-binding protein